MDTSTRAKPAEGRPTIDRSEDRLAVRLVTDRLVLSVREAADALAVSDDLIYELVARGALPCLCFGRRKVIPRRAIELVIEAAMDRFDPQLVLADLSIGTNTLSNATASGISA